MTAVSLFLGSSASFSCLRIISGKPEWLEPVITMNDHLNVRNRKSPAPLLGPKAPPSYCLFDTPLGTPNHTPTRPPMATGYGWPNWCREWPHRLHKLPAISRSFSPIVSCFWQPSSGECVAQMPRLHSAKNSCPIVFPPGFSFCFQDHNLHTVTYSLRLGGGGAQRTFTTGALYSSINLTQATSR